jgi:hypothetical protein
MAVREHRRMKDGEERVRHDGKDLLVIVEKLGRMTQTRADKNGHGGEDEAGSVPEC